MGDPTTDELKRAGSGAATGAAYGGVPGALVGAGVSVLGPLVAKGLGSMFGLDEASPEERKAAADREAALQKLRDAAEGKTASAAQLQAQQQQQRTIQALSSMAARGTAQQQAGAQRAAMQAAPEVMAQQGATAAMARAAEMSAARRDLGAMQLQASQQQAAEGAANRKYMQGVIGAGVAGAAGAGAMAMTQSPDKEAGSLKGNAAEAYNEEQAQQRAQHYKSMPSVPETNAAVEYSQVAPVQHVGQAGQEQSPATSFALTAPPPFMAAESSPASGRNFGGNLKSPTLQLGRRSRNALYGPPALADVFQAIPGMTMPKLGGGY